MRRTSLLSSLSASLVALTLGTVAAASPSVLTKSGSFHASDATVTASSSNETLEKAAKSVLADQVEASRGATFGKGRVVRLAGGDHVVKLPQMHMGLPVVHRGASVTWRGGTARVVSARLESELPDDVSPALASDMAAKVAAARTGMSVGQTRLALWPTAEGVRLVWAMAATPIVGLPYLPVTIVDAKSGEIVLVYNAIVELNQTKVYPSNPVKSPTLIDVTLPVEAGKTVLENELVQSLNCIDQKSVKDVSVMGFNLQVHTCDLLQTALADANGDFQIAPGANDDPEDAFSEVSMFYHVNLAYDMFRGWDPALNVNNGPISTVSNLRIPQGFQPFDQNKLKDPDLPLTPFQNAFFAPADPIFSSVFGLNGGAMWFGQGPVNDYAYDGDVVYHEFTHAVVQETLKLVGNPHMDEFGTSYSPGAMNEGLADYFSSALTGDGDVGEYASQDFFPGSLAIRSLTNKDSCPTAVGGEVHQDATLFSGGLWDVRVTLPPEDQKALDGAVFAAMNIAPTGDLGYEDFATLVLEQVKANISDAVAQALTDAWTTRGVLPQCTRVLEFTGTKLTGPNDLQGLWWGPGTQTTGAKNSAGGWTPGVVQFHYSLPADTTKLTFEVREVAVGGGGFGGGTPFAATFLVRFGKEPLQFTYKPTAATPDVIEAKGEKAAGKWSVTIDVPAGSTEVHVMVGSTGQADSAYTDFTATPTVGPQTTGSVGSGGSGGDTGGSGGSGGSGGAGGSDQVVTGGCGCSVPGSNAPEGAALAAFAALGLIAARRRRSSRR